MLVASCILLIPFADDIAVPVLIFSLTLAGIASTTYGRQPQVDAVEESELLKIHARDLPIAAEPFTRGAQNDGLGG
jgi:hypothetical protein